MTTLPPLIVGNREIPVDRCGVLVIGSGAASLAAADRLAALASVSNGPTIADDTVIVTESLQGGTSRNAGSDKQTYYRLALTEREGDSAYDMARAIWDGGAVHGDIALAEAVGSLEAFYHLVSIGVPFPMNSSGSFVGYKTDHDPRKRGTSIGPYTSKVMVERLLQDVNRWGIPILEGLHAVALVAAPPSLDEQGIQIASGRVFGALFVDQSRLEEPSYGLRFIAADAVVFGVGGPGGLYGSSVYPRGHSGAIGLALEVGAPCVNLTESQFGLSSLGFRWNVSGTYQQAVPRYVSVGPDGDEEEFLNPYFSSPGARDSAVFLKGYQWPFDPRKVAKGGSSLIDLLVHRERLVKGRRVFMDFRRNSEGWNTKDLNEEARHYLERCSALEGTPYDRLMRMNPIAVEHYASHGIDLAKEMLEIGVCAQHNNGGLAADEWWESTGMDRLFPVGEVNGSHGVYRPGGSALNAGQVGALRSARRIVGAYAKGDLRDTDWRSPASERARELVDIIQGALGKGKHGVEGLDAYQREFKGRMDRVAGIIRPVEEARKAAKEALDQYHRFKNISIDSPSEIPDLLRSRHLVLAHAAYLEAIASYIEADGGSRGSYIVAGSEGVVLHPALDQRWNSLPEKKELLEYLEELRYLGDGTFKVRWEARRPIPETDDWFETVWRAFREGEIFNQRRNVWSRSN